MIEISNIRKAFQMGDNTLEVLKGVTLSIQEGDFVAIMGPSGSGKSTLMNILGLLDVPTSGSYKLNSIETSRMSEDELAVLRRDVLGFIFQQFNLLSRVSALHNVALPLLYSKKENVQYAQELLNRVGLSDRLDHHPNELSGGQQQRVAIARSLVNQPMIVFADEPTGNLDSQSEKEIMKILRELNESGITVIMVTHEEEIGQQAKRLIRMRDGVIQSDERLRPFEILPQTFQSKTNLKATKTSPFDFLDYFFQGLRTLAANKVRTLLSMLGVMIGVAAVVTMLAVGQGAQESIKKQLSSLGSNLLTVRPGVQRVGGVSQESSVANRLQYADKDAIKKMIPNVKAVSAQVSGRAQITAKGSNWNTQIQATSVEWAQMRDSVPVQGRFFDEYEVRTRARVAVIGSTVARELFGDKSPIGETLKINKVIFQVIGVLPTKGATGFRDQDDVVVIPVLTGMYRLLGKSYIDYFEVEVDRPENVNRVESELSEALVKLYRIPLSQQADAFQIWNMADLQKTIQKSSQTMSLLLSSIAAISLVVGGIGIMNIMLVSVTERTKEIGLRKAVGAQRKDILAQFLSESVVISLVGGVCGILLGWLSTLILSSVLGWGTTISLASVVLSFSFSVLIGMIFGVYPAQKASRLNPIDALRYE